MRRLFARGLALGAGGTGAVALVALLRNILIARVMGPAAFGLWQVCLVVLRLGGESHLGALHAVAVETPILRGAAREDDARRLERMALGTTLVLGLVAGAIGGVALRLEGGPAVATTAVLLVGTVAVQQVFLSDGTVLRTRRGFGRLAALQAAFALFHLAGLLILLPSRFLTGALVAWAGAQAIAVVLVRVFSKKQPLPRPALPRPRDALAVTRTGALAWLVSAVLLALLQTDRIVVAALLGAEDLGQYGILLLGGAVLLMLPDLAASILWPFAGERFGASGRDPAALGALARESLRSLTPVLAALLLLAFQATDALVAHVLPQYEASLLPLRLYLPGIYFVALSLPLRHLLVTAGVERPLLAAQLGVLALAIGAETAMALAGWGIEGVALASAAAGAMLFVAVLMLSARRLAVGDAAGWAGAAAVLFALVALALDQALAVLGPTAATLAGAGLRCGVPLLLLVAAAVPVAMRLLRNGDAPARAP